MLSRLKLGGTTWTEEGLLNKWPVSHQISIFVAKLFKTVSDACPNEHRLNLHVLIQIFLDNTTILRLRVLAKQALHRIPLFSGQQVLPSLTHHMALVKDGVIRIRAWTPADSVFSLHTCGNLWYSLSFDQHRETKTNRALRYRGDDCVWCCSSGRLFKEDGLPMFHSWTHSVPS